MIKKIISLVVAATQMFALTTGALAADEKYFEGNATIGDWTFMAHTGTMVTYEVTDENGYQGKSLHITKKKGTTPNVYSMLWKYVSVKAKTNYRYSMVVKAKDANDIFSKISWADRHELNPIGSTFDWVELSFDWYNSGGDATKEFQISFDGSIKDLWIDNIKFCEVLPDGTLGPNQIKNWDFEGGTTAAAGSSSYPVENERIDIVNAKGGNTEKLLETVSLDTNIPVFRSENEIVPDGDLSEWDDYTPIIIPSKDDQYKSIIEYSGAKDCSGEFKFCYDDEYYYVGGIVTDEKFDDNKENMWEQDSIQINFGKKGTSDYYGYGLKYTPDGGMLSCNMGDSEEAKLIKYGVAKPDGTHYVYEAAIPKNILYDGDSDNLTFNVLINDNDGSGRATYIQWQYGIGEGAGSAKYGKVIFVENGQKIAAWYPEPINKIEAEIEYEVPVWIASFSEKAETVSLTDVKGTREVNLPANGSVLKNVTVKSDIIGESEIGVDIICGDEKLFSGMHVSAELNTEYYVNKFKELEEKFMPEIESLMKQCEDMGISCEYEKSDLWVIKKFLVYGVDDAENDFKSRSEYVYNCLVKICSDLTQRLKGYLDGTETPKQTSKYSTSEIEIDGQSFIAEDDSGAKRPVYFMGYGHFSTAMNTIPEFSELGVNIVQTEFGPTDVITGENEDGFIVNTTKLDSLINSRLKLGYDNNVQICLLISPHYIPAWFTEKYPEACSSEDGSMFRTAYYDTHPKMREMLDTYMRAIANVIKESPYREALNSICLTNETSHSRPASEDLPDYQAWLEDKFDGDLDALNEAYNTSYISFTSIPYPDVDELVYNPDKEENRAKLPQFADWEDYNDNFVGDFHGWMTDVINEVDPTIPTHAKYMQEFDLNEREWRRQFVNFGTDPEEIAEHCVINGNDANNYFKHGFWGILNKMSYYDLQTSCLRAPVFDSEDHVVTDRNTNYDRDIYYENHVAADMWQGAIHGRGGSTIWVWERTYSTTNDFAGSILHRPDMLLEASHAMLDVNVFANELTALQNKERTVGILYSETSRVYSLRNSNSLVNSYEGASYLGERIEFVTEKQAASGKLKNNEEINILVVPYSTHVLDGVLEDIKAFIDKGGSVVIIGEDSLMYNQHDKPFDEQLRKYVFDNSIVMEAVPTPGARDTFDYPLGKDIWNTLVPLEDKYTEDIPVVITDAVTGNRAWGVHFVAEELDGELLVNICDYEYDGGKVVDIRYNGQIVGEGVELRSGKDITCGSIALDPYAPILVSIPLENLPGAKSEFEDIKNHWARYAVGDLAETGIIKGTSETEFTPQSDVKVSEFAAMLGRGAGKDDSAYLSLVNASPDAKITREQMAHMLVSVYKELKGTLPEAIELGFTDIEASQYKDDINMAVTLGHMTGYGDNTMNPGNTATRAEAAAVIRRFMYSLDHEITIGGKKNDVDFGYSDELIFFDRKDEK